MNNNKDMVIGMYIRPIKDNIISIIGNKEFKLIDIKEMVGNVMVKIENHKNWFNINDFEEGENGNKRINKNI